MNFWIAVLFKLLMACGLVLINRWTISDYIAKEKVRKESPIFTSCDTAELFGVCVVLPIVNIFGMLFIMLI